MAARLLIVAVLWFVMLVPLTLGVDAGLTSPTTLAAFGFIVLAATALGELAHTFRLPHITGYLLAGLVWGEGFAHVLHERAQVLWWQAILSENVVGQLKLFDKLAIALIAMEAGSHLDWSALRERWRSVVAMNGSIFALGISAGVVAAFAMSGILPFSVPFLDGQGSTFALAVGLMLGTTLAATSPPITMAVLHENRARGRFTDIVLGTVLLNDVFIVVGFAVAVGVARTLIGSGTEPFVAKLLVELTICVGLGAMVALITGAALRFFRRDALLVVVGLAFVVTHIVDPAVMQEFLGKAYKPSPLLTFLVAGVLLNNVTRLGGEFHSVARMLSGPVYVLFFTLVGADLHIDAIIRFFPLALGLVLLRMGVLSAAPRLASKLPGVSYPPEVIRYGALAFAPQAGIALATAKTVETSFPLWGSAYATIVVGAIALNEMVGPILLQHSLRRTGEAHGQGPSASEDVPAPAPPASTEAEPARLAEWLPEQGHEQHDPWGLDAKTGDKRLDVLCRELALELQDLVRDLQAGPIARRRNAAREYTQLLRREFLRTHRRAVVKAAEPGLDAVEWKAFLIRQRAELAHRVHALIIDRANVIDFRDEQTALQTVLDSLDRAADTVKPSAMSGQLEPSHLTPRPTDTTWRTLAKSVARLRLNLARGLGLDAPHRTIEVRDLLRFHLKGYSPVYLREVAGLLTLSERQLLARTRSIYYAHDRSLVVVQQGPIEDRLKLLDALKSEVDDDFDVAFREIDRLADETVRAAGFALGRPFKDFVHDLVVAGSPSLPRRQYQFTRVNEQRDKAISSIRRGFGSARDLCHGMASRLALELELIRMTGQVRERVHDTATQIARDVRGKLGVQVERVDEALETTLRELRAILDDKGLASDVMLERLNEATAPLAKVIVEAVAIADHFRNELQETTPLQALSTALTQQVDTLTEHLVVVFDDGTIHGRGLPRTPTLAPIPFRELVRSWAEIEIGRALAALADDLSAQVEFTSQGIEEVDRVLVFNSELARSELEVLEGAEVPPHTRRVLEDTLLGTLSRAAGRVQEMSGTCEALAERMDRSVRAAVLDELDNLRKRFDKGQQGELRIRQAQAHLATGRRELRSELRRLLGAAVESIRGTLGDETIDVGRRWLGLPDPEARLPLGPTSFLAPKEQIELPVAYRRVFTDQALEAGDLLQGRKAEVSRVRQVLVGEGQGRSRAVAVVGLGGMGKQAVVHALVRGLGDRARVVRAEWDAPVTDPSAVDAIVDEALEAAAQGTRTVVVVSGFEWLFSIEPGGFEVLRRFVARVVETADRVGWLVSANRAVWAYADRVVPLHDAFPERVDLLPLTMDELRRAVLSRHAMSGYRLIFRKPQPNLATNLRVSLTAHDREQQQSEEQYFQALHSDSGGILSDALRLWMASLVAVDIAQDAVIVGPVPHPPIRSLRRLPMDILLTLRQVARQGRITAVQHAEQFRWGPEDSLALLTRLAHWGLLQERAQAYVFHPDLAGPLYRVLRERELVG